MLHNNFQKYQFLNDFVAIYSQEQGTIEALVHHSSSAQDVLRVLSGGSQISKLLTALGVCDVFSGQEFLIEQSTDALRKLRVSIGIQSQASRAILAPYELTPQQLSMKIENVDIADCSPFEVLKKLSTSLFFEIDALLDITLSLQRTKQMSLLDFTAKGGSKKIDFPQNTYKPEPVSFYLYGRRATGLPFLQYLAFYQVLEYFFPQYAEAEATRTVKSTLMETGFSIERFSDIRKLRDVCERALGPKEVNQLRSTLEQCVSDGELDQYLRATEERKRFFSQQHKDLCSHRLQFSSSRNDFRTQVSRLVYDIRCKIIHTKAHRTDPDRGLLLPDSSQADRILPFVELVRFLAQKAIIRSAEEMSL